MMRSIPVLASACAVFAASCASQPPARHTTSHPPLSASEHQRHATGHERAAEAEEAQYRPEEQGAAEPVCVDYAMAVPEPESGGERIPLVKPCWVSERNPSASHLETAKRQRRAAADHRARARELTEAERVACQGLGEEEISHSPFYHREDIARVEELREGDRVVGVRVYFRKVPGLTADWMRKATRCHQARAAVMGYDTKFMAYCPLMLESIAVSVEEQGEYVVVSLRSDRDEMAAAALGRARDLLAPPRAEAPKAGN